MAEQNWRTLRVEEMPSGAEIGYVLPNIQRMLLAGAFPTPIVPMVRRFVSSKLDIESEQTDEQIMQWEDFQSHLVAWMVRQIDGCDVSLSAEEVSDPDRFPGDDRAALFSRAIRIVPAPKATRVDPAPKGMKVVS